MRNGASKPEPSVKLRARADRELLHRTTPSRYSYPLLAIVLGAAAFDRATLPAIYVTLVGAMIAVSLIRVVLARRFEDTYVTAPRRWRLAYQACLIVNAALWSAASVVVLVHDPTPQVAFFTYLVLTAISGVAIIVFAPDRTLLATYLTLLLLPSSIAVTTAEGRVPWLILGGGIAYLGYLWNTGRQLHTSFWNRLHDHAALEDAQAALETTHEELESRVEQRTAELREANRLLAVREQDYRAIFDNAHDAIVLLDPSDETVLKANPRASEIYGLPEHALLGRSMRSLTKDPGRGDRHLSATMAGERSYRFDTVHFDAEGKEIQLEIHASLTTLEGREAILSINRDVTTRRQAQALRMAKEAAERANQAKSAFLATMSHEIRTPMAGIIGLADLLLRADLDSEAHDYAATMKSAGESLLRLIDDILDLSKIEAGRLDLDPTPFTLHTEIDRVEKLLAPRAASQNLGFEVRIDSRLDGWFEGDALRLRQILVNLIGNAIKFTPHGGIELTVDEVAALGTARRIRFAVTDTGVGIPRDQQHAVFSPFRRAEGAEGAEGTGLGLAICDHLVGLMGGRLTLDSAAGAGTVISFEITLPAAQPPSVRDHGESKTDTARPGHDPRTDRRQEARILLVDDNRVNQLVAHRQLVDLGYQVEIATDGASALKRLADQRFDLVLMDCQMPELDGYESTRRLRAAEDPRRRVPVIALTAHAMKGDRERCLEAGMNDYLAKPFRRETLAALLDHWLLGEAESVEHEASNDDQALDPSYIEELLALGDGRGSGLLGRVTALLFDENALEELGRAVEAADAEAVVQRAHALKGSVGCIGALRLAGCYSKLEEAARSGDLSSAPAQMARIAEEQVRVERALRALLPASTVPTPDSPASTDRS